MGWHSEKSLYSLTVEEIIKEKKIGSGYYSDCFEEIINEQKNSIQQQSCNLQKR